MPYFVYRCYDLPGMEAVRDRIRPAHREHLARKIHTGWRMWRKALI